MEDSVICDLYTVYIYYCIFIYSVYVYVYIYIYYVIYIYIIHMYIYIHYIYIRIPEHNQHNSYIGVCENGAYSYRMAIKYSRTWWFINQRILGYPIFDKATWPTWNLVAAQKKSKRRGMCSTQQRHGVQHNTCRMIYIYDYIYIHRWFLIQTKMLKKTCWTKKELGPWGVQLRKKL